MQSLVGHTLYLCCSYLLTHVIFMPHKHQICGNMVQNCLKPTTPSRSTEVQTHGWCHSVGNQVVEVIEIGNRNTGIIKNFRVKCQFMRQNMRYVHFAEMYEKCGNK